MHGRGDGAAPSAIYLGGPDYHIGRETESHSYSRPPIPNRESVPSPWPWLWDTLQREWNEAQLANEAHRRGEDWLTDECFLYEEGKYDKPLRHLGKRDASGKFCNVNGQLVPMDEPLREVGPDLVPLHTPIPQTEPDSQRRSPTPPPPPHTAHPSEAPKSQPEDPRQVPSPKRGGLGRGLAPKGDGGPKENPELSLRKEVPKEETQVSSLNHAPIPPDAAIPIERKRTLGESAKQFASGFSKGVRDETAHMYRDVTELPHRVATTGRELLEDIQAGRKLRALAPVEAIGHAIRNASREDAKKIALAVVDGAIDFYNKSPQEQGEALGKATVSVASDVAIAALTDGLGSVAGLRKAEKALEAADHVKDASKAAGATTTVLSDVTVVSKGKIVGQGNVYLRPTIEKIESGGLRPRDTFTNREGLLPPRPAGYYKEYVHPTEGISGPGSQRIVRGAGGEMYYTPDHYKTFVPLHGSSSR
jgi:guanyl-specific ribonuclease Sa